MERRRYPESEKWRAEAACRNMDTNIFFPIATSTGKTANTQITDQTKAAKSVCRTCPVQNDCLEFALITNQEAGIWGGADEDERRKMRRDRRINTKRKSLTTY